MSKALKRFVNKWKSWQIVLLVLFFAWFIGVNLYLAWNESQTIDEAAHITAGYSYITTRDFRLNPEHPPLLKELSAVPLLALNVKNVKSLANWNNADEWKAGKEFVYSSPASARQIIFTARIAPILVACLLGLLVFTLAAYFTNKSWGLLALGLYVLDPNIIAHSHLVTTDIGSALGFLLVLASLFYYVNKPSVKRLIFAGLSFGVALSLKFSSILAIIFVPLLIGLSIFLFEKGRLKISKKVALLIGRTILVCVIAGLLVWVIYGFEVIKPAGNAAYSGVLANDNQIFVRLQNFHIPLYSFLRGLGRVFIHSESGIGHRSVYLLGNYSSGEWYYFFVAFLVKTPYILMAGLLASLLVASKKLYLIIKRKTPLTKKTAYIFCLCFFVAYYLIASTQTSINIGWRHILPIYPVLFILIAIAFSQLKQRSARVGIKPYFLAIVVLLGLTITLARHWPYTLSYSNELLPVVNTKTNWPRLADSNLDWGQDMYRMIDYVKKHPNNTYYYQLFSNADLAKIGAPSNLILGDKSFDSTKCHLTQKGVLILSYQIVYNDNIETTFDCMRGQKPDLTVGSSVLIFNR